MEFIAHLIINKPRMIAMARKQGKGGCGWNHIAHLDLELDLDGMHYILHT